MNEKSGILVWSDLRGGIFHGRFKESSSVLLCTADIRLGFRVLRRWCVDGFLSGSL